MGAIMINEFRSAMQAAGITPPNHIIGDGQLHRFHIGGDKSGTLNGVYFLHLDNNPNGWFSDWRGTTGKWSANGKAQSFTKEMRHQIEQERKQREEEKQLRHEQAVCNARIIWGKSTPATHHQYLTNKRVQPHDTRLHHESLVIPIYDENKRLVNLQFISPNGDKRFLSGARKKGCFSDIGKDNSMDTILLCEGFSTGASLHEHTGYYTAIALDAGNLLPVAQVMKQMCPMASIIVCGDNDESGVGQKAAINAALAIGGKYLIPETIGYDWNDSLTAVVL
jgi:putative DNA primase/helicase